jgi:hypothetical protein
MTTTAKMIKAALIGQVKKMLGSPWDVISERRRFCSAIGPRIKARKIGGTG